MISFVFCVKLVAMITCTKFHLQPFFNLESDMGGGDKLELIDPIIGNLVEHETAKTDGNEALESALQTLKLIENAVFGHQRMSPTNKETLINAIKLHGENIEFMANPKDLFNLQIRTSVLREYIPSELSKLAEESGFCFTTSDYAQDRPKSKASLATKGINYLRQNFIPMSYGAMAATIAMCALSQFQNPKNSLPQLVENSPAITSSSEILPSGQKLYQFLKNTGMGEGQLIASGIDWESATITKMERLMVGVHESGVYTRRLTVNDQGGRTSIEIDLHQNQSGQWVVGYPSTDRLKTR